MPATTMMPLTQAAHTLNLSWQQAWRMLLKGELRGTQTNGRWFVDRDSVERLALEREAEDTAVV